MSIHDRPLDQAYKNLSRGEIKELAELLHNSYFTNPAQDIRVESLVESGLVSIKKQDNKLLLSNSQDDRDLHIAIEILKWVAYAGLTPEEALSTIKKLEKL